MSKRSCSLLACALVVWSAAAAYGQTVLYHFNRAASYPRGGVVSYNGLLYGTTYRGGYDGTGTVYSIDPATSTPAVLASFSYGQGGWTPNDMIVVGSYLYGTAYEGGAGYGTVFRFDPATNQLTTVAQFNGTSLGSKPVGRLVADGSILYGATEGGGANGGAGTIFKFNTATNVLSNVASLGGVDALAQPNGGLLVSGSLLYGTAKYGGGLGVGGIFSVNTTNGVVTQLASFDGANGARPSDGMVVMGSLFYGTADTSNGNGRLFSFDPSNNTLTGLAAFNGTNGRVPVAGLTVSGSTLFGVTQRGGASGLGTIFKFESGVITTLTSLSSATGTLPSTRVIVSGSVLYGTTSGGGSLSGQGVVFKFETSSNTYTKLFEFNPTGAGSYLYSGMTALGSYLYGVTLFGGTQGSGGSIYRLNPATGAVDDPWISFPGSLNSYVPMLVTNAASYPYSGFVTDGTYLYGASANGGANAYGCVYRVDPVTQAVTILGSFNYTDGQSPKAGLLLANGFLYGTTQYGGANNGGTVFKVPVAGGAITALASFPAQYLYPESELLLYNGFLYGTTRYGGTSDRGRVYRVDATTGAMTTVVDFGANAGAGRYPYGGLILSGGFFWGLTSAGGANGSGTIYKVDVNTNALTTVLSLTSTYAQPSASFFSDGTYFYATSSSSGITNHGTVFKFNPATNAIGTLGTFTGSNGGFPSSILIQNGSLLYGTTAVEGSYGGGVLFTVPMNAVPTITAAAAAARTVGAGASPSTVATVSDFENAAGSLQVTATSVPANIEVTGISNSGGTITASIEAKCGATAGANSITFQVTDSGGRSATAVFTVNVTSASCSLVASPQGVTATALSSAIIRIQWQAVSGATGYRVYRSTGNAAFACINCGPTAYTQTTIDDGNVFANTAYVYRVLAAQGAFLSDPSAPDAATTVIFDDDPITTGSTRTKAIHLTQLRTAVNALRAAAGLGAATFTDPSPAGVRIKAVHVTELRTALNAARAAIGCAVLGAQSWPCGLPTLSYTDPSLAAGAQIKAAHFQEVRNGTK